MELLWYCIREMDADALERALRMMDGERRRRVAELPNEDDRKRSAAGELLARQAAAKRLNTAPESVALRWDENGKP